jgi:hypothetical protein
MANNTFDFGNMLSTLFSSKGIGSDAFATGAKAFGDLGGFGANIWNMLNTKDFMKGQEDIQRRQLGMQEDVFGRNKAKEDALASLDFTSTGAQ